MRLTIPSGNFSRVGRLAIALGVVLSSGAVAHAADLSLDFVQGLRARGYYDVALSYLEDLAGDASVPADVKAVIPFERAVTLVEHSRTLRTPEAQEEALDRAAGFLEEFVQANPDHPRAGEAESQRATILMDRARVEIYKAQSPANEGNKPEYQKKARDLIAKAREIFQSAHDKHKAAWESYPKFIDEQDNRQLFAERQKAETAYLRAQLDLALTTYEEAQTYDKTDPKFTSLLQKAAEEFETLHSKYRSMGVGLFARLWQGKCYEEQGEIRRALGVYNELLEHPGTSQTLQRLKAQALHFRLICLNHDKKNDHTLVLQEALPWLKDNQRSLARSMIGVGVRWEAVQAAESLGMKRTAEKGEREKNLRLALDQARQVNRYQGRYKDVSTYKIQSLEVALRGDSSDPQDFDGSLGLARNMLKELKSFDDSIEKARSEKKPAAEIAKLQADRDAHLSEAARILNLALSFADAETDLEQVNTARYNLAYVYYLLRRNYDAAVLGDFVGTRYREADPVNALEGSYLELGAWQQEYNDTKEEQRDFVIRRMIAVADRIATNWPQSDYANKARMTLGDAFTRMKRPSDAAAWFSKVPESADVYEIAQLAAAQAYWEVYREAATMPEEKKPPAEELDKWRSAAETHFKTGIEKTESKIPPTTAAPPDLVAGKVSYAQLLINRGDYKQAVDLLVNEPHAVMTAIILADGEPEPKQGVKSREFRSLAYQLLLRGYVGQQEIDKALGTMKLLEESLKGGEGGVTEVYVQLGRQLEAEIERLKGLDQTERLAEVRGSFDKFLSELYKRRDQMTYGSLIWIAETYRGLATGMGADDPASAQYFEKAASTYQDILDRNGSGQLEIPEGKTNAVKLRLIACRRQEGAYKPALELVRPILEESPTNIDAQMEAAYIFQNWGESGRPESHEHFLDAVSGYSFDGDKQDKLVWGWAQTANRLQRLIEFGQSSDALNEKAMEARFNISDARRKYAMAQSSTQKQTEQLQAAQAEIAAFPRIAGDEVSDQWKARFNELYRTVQTDLGLAPEDLEWPEPIVLAQNTAAPAVDDAQTGSEGATKKSKAAVAPPPDPPNTILIGLAVLVALVAAGGMMFYMMKKPVKRRRIAATAGPAPTFGESPDRSRSAGRSRSGSSSSSERKRSSQGQSQSQSRSTQPGEKRPGEPRKKDPGASRERPKKPPSQ